MCVQTAVNVRFAQTVYRPPLFQEFGADGFTPQERRAGELDTLLDQLVSLTARLGISPA